MPGEINVNTVKCVVIGDGAVGKVLAHSNGLLKARGIPL